MQNRKKELILVTVSLGFTILLTILIDYMLGELLVFAEPEVGLVYPPNTTVTYKTVEFEFVAHINELGFRGNHFEVTSSHPKFRILILGDSFTYGWGVNDEAIWSSVLADHFSRKGIFVEVANLGWVGRGPTEYADNAEKAIPLLKPDLVIVAILQGDDLQQLRPAKIESSEMGSGGFDIPYISIRDTLRKVYPNISRLLQQVQQMASSKELQYTWQNDAEKIFSAMSSEEVARFQALDPEIQQLFFEGLLNPYQVALGVRTPNYFLDAIDMKAPATQVKINALTSELGRIKKVALANEARVIVVAVPYGIYVNEYYIKNQQRLGFKAGVEMLSSTAPDEAIALAAKRADLKFFSVLDRFRQSSEPLFYDLDGHFTVAGNQLFAQNLLPIVEDEYQRYQSRKTTSNNKKRVN